MQSSDILIANKRDSFLLIIGRDPAHSLTCHDSIFEPLPCELWFSLDFVFPKVTLINELFS